MTRRALLVAPAAALAAPVPRTSMGVAATCYMSYARPRDTLAFLEQCAALGAGGCQATLSSLDPAFAARLGERARQLGLYFEAMAALPKTDDTSLFDRTVAAAQEAGALVVRCACLSGRRYETFADLDSWRRFAADSRAAIGRALKVVEKRRLPLALENHKDWTADEFALLLREFSHPLLGVCLDTGNNISLLDDPMEVVRTLAPFALSTHIKDMGVERWEEGFLLSEVRLGEGMLDLRGMVETVRAARPATRFTLEMITRDPLKVPCLGEKYWTTFPDRSGAFLARTLRLVNERAARTPLPRVASLPREEQLRREDENVRACLEYARTRLGLA